MVAEIKYRRPPLAGVAESNFVVDYHVHIQGGGGGEWMKRPICGRYPMKINFINYSTPSCNVYNVIINPLIS